MSDPSPPSSRPRPLGFASFRGATRPSETRRYAVALVPIESTQEALVGACAVGWVVAPEVFVTAARGLAYRDALSMADARIELRARYVELASEVAVLTRHREPSGGHLEPSPNGGGASPLRLSHAAPPVGGLVSAYTPSLEMVGVLERASAGSERLALRADLPPGSPVLDAAGSVVAMALGRRVGGRTLLVGAAALSAALEPALGLGVELSSATPRYACPSCGLAFVPGPRRCDGCGRSLPLCETPAHAAELLDVREALARAGLVHRFAAFHDESLPFRLDGRPAFAEGVASGAFVRVSVLVEPQVGRVGALEALLRWTDHEPTAARLHGDEVWLSVLLPSAAASTDLARTVRELLSGARALSERLSKLTPTVAK
jgi:hypothetical protein